MTAVRLLLRITVCLVAVTPGACARAPTLQLTPDDFTLAGVPADVDSTEIRMTFGDPDSIATVETVDGTPLTAWIYDGFEVRFSGQNTPSGYMIREPGERTARGVGVGDPARLVRRLYGDPTAQHASRWAYVSTADEGAAELNVIELVIEADTVRSIYVGQATD